MASLGEASPQAETAATAADVLEVVSLPSHEQQGQLDDQPSLSLVPTGQPHEMEPHHTAEDAVTTLGQRLWSTAVGLEHHTVGSWLYPVLRAAGRDVNRGKTRLQQAHIVTSGLGYVATQAAGKVKAPSLAISYSAMGTLAETGNPLAAAGAAAVINLAWSNVATHTTNHAVNNFQQATLETGRQFPKTIKFVSGLLHGLEPVGEAERAHARQAPTHHQLGKRALTLLKRGATANIQLTPYIVTAGLTGQSPEERGRLCRVLSFDAAVVTGLTYGAIATAIELVAQDQPKVAEQIQHDVKSPLLWWSIGALTVTTAKLREHRRQKRAPQ